MNEHINIDNILNSISTDISNSIKNNLSKVINSIEHSNKILDLLNNLLIELPEYRKLRLDYYGLLIKNKLITHRLNRLKVENITLNIQPIVTEIK